MTTKESSSEKPTSVKRKISRTKRKTSSQMMKKWMPVNSSKASKTEESSIRKKNTRRKMMTMRVTSSFLSRKLKMGMKR